MDCLVECVPNFSEGRKTEIVGRLCDVIESVAGAWVLDTHVDAEHNRSVITFVAEPAAAVEAAVRVVLAAVELIDLRQHAGQHPRIGALDVLPFVPIGRGVSLAECVGLAHEAGRRIWQAARVPVYFYGSAARRPDRVNLEDVRLRGGFEQLREEIGLPEREPDVGEPRLHETAGACVVGARSLLVAYNVNLHTKDIKIARRIARAVRGRDGGLRHLKALGFELPERGLTQVSMNLVRFEQTEMHHAFLAVKREAEQRWGVAVAGSEIVGLVPQAALDHTAEYFLQLENFKPELVLENRIAAALARRSDGERGRQGEGETGKGGEGEGTSAESPDGRTPRREDSATQSATRADVERGDVDDQPSSLSPRLPVSPSSSFPVSPSPRLPLSPSDEITGGGVAAAHAAALAAALGEMVARLVGRKSRGQEEVELAAQDALQELGSLRGRLTAAAGEDAMAFARVLDARRLPRSPSDEAADPARRHVVEAALKGATAVPLEIARVAVQVGDVIETLAEVSDPGWLSDAASGAQLVLSAVNAARYNVLVNTASVEDEEFAAEQRARCDDLLERAREITGRIERMLLDSLQR